MRSFKKIAAMTLAVAMLCSFTALGATVSPFDIADVTEGTEVTINYTSDASQNTVLVYAGTSLSNANVVYIDQLVKNATRPTVDLTNAPANTTYTVMVGGADVATAATDTFFYGVETATYNVTLTAGANGTASADKDLDVAIEDGDVVNFTFVPNLGYKLDSVLINDVPTSVSGNTYALTVEGNTTVQPVFAADAAIDTAPSYTYEKVFDLTAADAENVEKAFDSKIFFGKALASASEKTIVSMGMYVIKDGVEFETTDDPATAYDESVGPYFAAAKKTADNKYGIRFYAFPAGNYEVKAYVKYDDGSYEYGDAVEFTVSAE